MYIKVKLHLELRNDLHLSNPVDSNKTLYKNIFTMSLVNQNHIRS